MSQKGHDGWKVDDDHCFVGFDAYKRLLDSGVDYVMLCQPPGLRPLHFRAAIEAGKHVFFEKPVAVDPVGIRKIIEWGEKAKEKKLGVLPGTQSRHSAKMKETVRRIHEGQIGEIVSARIYFNTGYLWTREREPGMTDIEWQIRNWYYFDWLSGDHIVEQHVHQHDQTNWVLGAHPVRAVAVGGRQVRTEPIYGNIYDHFAVDYEYPNDVHVMSMCRHWEKCPGNVSEAIVGTKGKSNCSGWISGPNEYHFKGVDNKPYVQEHTDLIASIRSGNPLNEAEQVAHSTLVAIMGREAAFTGQLIKWDEFLKSNLDLSPAKYDFGPLPEPPVHMPGRNG